MHFRRKAGTDGRRHEAFRCIETYPRLLDLVTRRKQRGALRRSLQRFRDHDGNRLVRVTDLVALQEIEPKHEGIRSFIRILGERRPVRRRDHLDHPRMGFRCRHIKKGNAAARDAADREHCIEHTGRMLVGGISGATRHFEHAIAARERLTNVRAVPNVGGRL